MNAEHTMSTDELIASLRKAQKAVGRLPSLPVLIQVEDSLYTVAKTGGVRDAPGGPVTALVLVAGKPLATAVADIEGNGRQ